MSLASTYNLARLLIARSEIFSQQHNLSTFTLTCLSTQFLPEKRQRRTIIDKHSLAATLPDDYPEPWPYKEMGFHKNYILFNWSKHYHHTNSKLIVVEGNVASGKTDFARRLADELGFHFMPGFSMNEILIDRYGQDLRSFYHLFPKRFRVPDEMMFYKNPSDDLTAVMQDQIYECKWDQYLNALAHIFNTGQGVVLEKSAYSDFVFANAMREKNWIGPEYFKYYHFQRKVTLPVLDFWPHLVIYLDCPIWKCLENIRRRGNADEIACVDEKYLKTIEDSYKDYLREVKRHSYILSYDWTEPEYMDIILSDIYRLNLDWVEWHTGDVLEEWMDMGQDTNYGFKRYQVTHKREKSFQAFGSLATLRAEVAEIYMYPPDIMIYKKAMQNKVLKSPYPYGYTPRDGYKGLTALDQYLQSPERWYEYFQKEYAYDCLQPPDWFIDPLGKDYNPDAVHH